MKDLCVTLLNVRVRQERLAVGGAYYKQYFVKGTLNRGNKVS